jgi:hypothetical protein
MCAIQRSLYVGSGRPFAFAFVLVLAVAGGCKPSCVPVSGKVTYDDGTLIPADKIKLFFQDNRPEDPKVHPQSGMAEIDVKTGVFKSASTFAHNDGILKGEHKVIILCFVGGQTATDLVGPEYADAKKTPLTLDSSQSPFDIKVRKPTGEAAGQ